MYFASVFPKKKEHYTTLHYTTLHYTTLHYTILYIYTMYTLHFTLYILYLWVNGPTQLSTHCTHSSGCLNLHIPQSRLQSFGQEVQTPDFIIS